ncbi:MAG: putative quinol monooxygenase [Phenylobacterium sp.]|uniref:putative quinol monooxygenase n=1 Tax=Phenylobacterium sp. TaxID=1871053 RepID=UPI002733D671|nr:putative quinol monooxygenase [Phenylobacterium sp.]MDP3173855.1 putative quinol monooxygenase [Phenylobacterium sp.]
MTLIIAGTVRVPPENVESLRPHMVTVLASNRAEDGCETFVFSEDVGDPGLIHIFEVWRDQAALSAHGQSEHLKAWRAAGEALGVSERRLSLYEVASQRPL